MPAADALCRAPFGGAPDPPAPPPRQRTSISTNQSAWPRSPCPFRTLSRAGEGRRAPTPAISTIHEHHRGLPSPAPAFPEVALVTCLPGWPRHIAAARSAERRWFRGPIRLSPPRAPPGDDRSSPGLVTPILGRPDTSCRRPRARMAGGATFAGRARAHPAKPACADLAGTLSRTASVPTGRPRLRVAIRRRSRFHRTLRQGRLPRFPAKDHVARKTQGAFHRERPVHRDGGLLGKPSQPPGAPGKVGACPQVVPNLGINRRRLFNPCRLDTL